MWRMRRWVPVLVCVVLFWLAFEVARAHADSEMTGPYRAGPLAQRDAPVDPDWPVHGEELLVLGGIAAILYGFRASGLARGRSA
mgnify:CR=1 FL=1